MIEERGYAQESKQPKERRALGMAGLAFTHFPHDRMLAILLDGKSRKPMLPTPRVDKALEKAITDFL